MEMLLNCDWKSMNLFSIDLVMNIGSLRHLLFHLDLLFSTEHLIELQIFFLFLDR